MQYSVSSSGCSIPGEKAPGTHYIKDWARPRNGLDGLEKRKISVLAGNRNMFANFPACSLVTKYD